MKKYALPACYAKKIDIDFNSDSIQGALIIPGNVRKNIFLVFKEAINNIIKYSSATHCIAKMTIVHRRFILEVSDDGLGMGSSEKDKGSGMQNMRNRAKELRGALEISSQNNHGVTIRMIIPFPFKIPYTWDKRGIDYH